ncbi:MAG: dihydroorotase [Rhodospirillales bacterium]|jgi:dihydroorotase|nr:dihydroorotase [Rhodospirillales bacterium]
MQTTDSLTIIRPDDWHVHFRDGDMLDAVVPYTARQFGRAIVMPNLTPPVTTIEAATSYRERIMAAVPEGVSFNPLMTAYLTDSAKSDDLTIGYADGIFAAAKLYPANATTNSAMGVSDLSNVFGVLESMQDSGMPLLIHGEVTDTEVDIFDREAVFIDTILEPLIRKFPELRIVLEHVTTSQAVDFVSERHETAPGKIGATITAHHLMINRTDIFRGGIRPHLYCLPIAKREKHRLALRKAAISGAGPFFLGTDTAPHGVSAKQSACGCAGVFSAPVAIQAYTQVFDEENALDRLEDFASRNGPKFYGLPKNNKTLTLTRSETIMPEKISVQGGDDILPFLTEEGVIWNMDL